MPEHAHALAKSSIVETKGIEPSTSCLRRPRLPRLADVLAFEHQRDVERRAALGPDQQSRRAQTAFVSSDIVTGSTWPTRRTSFVLSINVSRCALATERNGIAQDTSWLGARSHIREIPVAISSNFGRLHSWPGPQPTLTSTR